MYSGTGKWPQDGFRDLLDSLWDGSEIKLHWTPDLCKSLTLSGEPQWHFGSPGINVSSEPVPSKLWKVPFLSFSYPGKRLQVLLGKTGGKMNSIHFQQCSRVSPSFKGFWVCKLAQVWKLTEGHAFLFLWCKLNIWLFNWELFPLHRPSKTLLSFLRLSSKEWTDLSCQSLGIYMLVEERHIRSKYFGVLISATKKTNQGSVGRVPGRGGLRLWVLRAQEEDPVKLKGWWEWCSWEMRERCRVWAPEFHNGKKVPTFWNCPSLFTEFSSI